ncbi:hypothetical protein [Achromobacter xylosoxidans]|uniref:hypothetical protein n=1 Tax=Alcaligenes xylosoxydans xylosoxydans TaxID=85698 RepID=UPI001EEB5079|nr:hypothetical protein [Achromobacter xylosoxidans]
MIYRALGYLAVALATGFAFFEFRLDFRYEDFRDFLTFLCTVSGMVFTIMGIWIAFLYPNAISRIVSPEKLVAADFSESGSDAKRLEKIVGAIISSSLVMVAVLILIFFKIILSKTDLYIQNILQFKSAALFAAAFMTLIQLESIVHVVIANVMFINDLHTKRQNRKSDEDI